MKWDCNPINTDFLYINKQYHWNYYLLFCGSVDTMSNYKNKRKLRCRKHQFLGFCNYDLKVVGQYSKL